MPQLRERQVVEVERVLRAVVAADVALAAEQARQAGRPWRFSSPRIGSPGAAGRLPGSKVTASGRNHSSPRRSAAYSQRLGLVGAVVRGPGRLGVGRRLQHRPRAARSAARGRRTRRASSRPPPGRTSRWSFRRTTFDQRSDPPPSPLATIPPRPRNDQTSKSPCSPSLGSQKLRPSPTGCAGRSRAGRPCHARAGRRTCPASASRCVITDPPKPEPTTTRRSGPRALALTAVGHVVMPPAHSAWPGGVVQRRVLTAHEAGRTVGRVPALASRGGSHGRSGAAPSTVSTSVIFEPLRLGEPDGQEPRLPVERGGPLRQLRRLGHQTRINWDLKFARGGVGAIISSNAPVSTRAAASSPATR